MQQCKIEKEMLLKCKWNFRDYEVVNFHLMQVILLLDLLDFLKN